MVKKGAKVFVGLSGGVDSAVSAALLQKQGYRVTGVFIKAWTPENYPCTWKEDRRSAMRVCAILNIPFITLDLEKEYKKEVVDYMIREYREGKTPNPDVMCNKEIKFGHFLDFALKNGADFVATGHYAVRYENHTKNTKIYGLKEGVDKNKDQSYFLWTLTQDQLKHILFPIGHLQKGKVRELAKKFGLPQANRKDSQGLCFLGKIDMKEFLQEYVTTKKGTVLDLNGNTIGEHGGAIFYTLGERHGFIVWNNEDRSKPLYVVSKDLLKNTITVSDMENQNLLLLKISEKIKIKNLNLNLKEIPKAKIKCRLRYRQQKISCRIVGEGNDFWIEIGDRDKITLAPSGQSIVFYDDEICLGGSVIA